jgi:hypothetical protein
MDIRVCTGRPEWPENLYENMPMATFSPDGAQIAFMGYGGIYLMSADGSNLRRLDPLGEHGGLDWPRSR